MTTKLFSPKVDYVFKKIFGSEAHPQVLISFLNACFKGDVTIKSVKIQNTEMTKEFVENSFSRLDILATTNLGEVINIEMQREDENNMVKRSLYYWSKVYTNAYNGKSKYEELPRTICINVLDFNLLDEDSHHNVYLIYNKENKNLLVDSLELHFIELPKLSDKDDDTLSQWLNFIIDPDSEQSLAAELKNPVIHEARVELTRLSRDPKEAEIYRQRENALSDKSNALISAAEKGVAKGKQENQRENALRAKNEGVSIDLIEKITGLSKEEIELL